MMQSDESHWLFSTRSSEFLPLITSSFDARRSFALFRSASGTSRVNVYVDVDAEKVISILYVHVFILEEFLNSYQDTFNMLVLEIYTCRLKIVLLTSSCYLLNPGNLGIQISDCLSVLTMQPVMFLEIVLALSHELFKFCPLPHCLRRY